MKVVPLGQARSELSAWVDQAQEERVLITRHGRPAAVIIGVEGEDFEDLLTRSNPRFWEMIERRRRGPTVTAAQARERLRIVDRVGGRRRGRNPTRG